MLFHGLVTNQVVYTKLCYQLTATLIYNLYLHPLAKFPGPFLGRASLVSHI